MYYESFHIYALALQSHRFVSYSYLWLYIYIIYIDTQTYSNILYCIFECFYMLRIFIALGVFYSMLIFRFIVRTENDARNLIWIEYNYKAKNVNRNVSNVVAKLNYHHQKLFIRLSSHRKSFVSSISFNIDKINYNMLYLYIDYTYKRYQMCMSTRV